LDSEERENDREIPNQQWKPANELEKGTPRFVPGSWEENEQSRNKKDDGQCGFERCDARMTGYSQPSAARQCHIGKNEAHGKGQEGSAEAVLPRC
jgi:hypothetical protein